MKIKTKNIVIVLLVILLLIFSAFLDFNDKNIVKVSKKSFDETIHAFGNLESTEATFIGCPSIRRMWNYTITYMAPEGKSVKKGDLLISFDSKKLQEKLMLKTSELNTVKKELEKVILVEQETLENYQLQHAEIKAKVSKLKVKAEIPKDLISMNDAKKSTMEYNLAEIEQIVSKKRVENQKKGMGVRINFANSKVKKLEREVVSLQKSIAKMDVKSKGKGIVVYSLDWDGEKKSVGDSTWRGDTILELPDLSKMQVAITISEPVAYKVKEGQVVEIKLDSNPDKAFKGEISSLGRIFRTKSYDQPKIIFDAIVSIETPDPEIMRPGMAASCYIIISKKENVLQLPEKAIVYNDNGTFVMKKGWFGKTSLTPVKIGSISKNQVEIIKGVKENDKIVILSEKENGE